MFSIIFLALFAVARAANEAPEPAYGSSLNMITLPGAEYLGKGMEDYMWHVGTPGTQHNRDRDDDPFFYTTNSYIPSLPQLSGFTGTHGTYRCFQVLQESFFVVGEPKKGLWRIQENGMIRQYRKFHRLGLFNNVDPNDEANLTPAERSAIWDDYDEDCRYFHPDQQSFKFAYNRYTNFIDLSIYHSKFHGKYDNHTAIDLPFFYAPLSQANFPYVRNIWNFVKAQRLTKHNIVGPLGQRAGLDITENYSKVVRVYLMPDASIWVNVKESVVDLNPNENVTTDYDRLDLSTYEYEIYIVERRMFFKKRLFVALVLNDGEYYGTRGNFSYLRPNGTYYENYVLKNAPIDVINDIPNFFPTVWVHNHSDPQHIVGLPVYGHDQPDRPRFKLRGGACPQMGGDLSHYPWGICGSGWPTNYQEIVPLCDAVLLDIKFWANLWIPSWNVNRLGLGNSAFDNEILYYSMDVNNYGNFTDPYLIGQDNPYACDLTGEGEIVPPRGPKPNPVTIALNFTRKGQLLLYYPSPDLFYAPPYEVALRYTGPYPSAVCTARRSVWMWHCPQRRGD